MRKYENPPIQEVTVNIKFNSKSGWSIVVPGQFYERSKELLPIIEHPKEKDKDQLPLFFSKERDFNVAIPNQAMSFKFIKPYKSWDNCKDIINKCISFLKDIANIEDIIGVELSYSNRIEVDKTWLDSNPIFTFSFEIQERVKERMESFLNVFNVTSKASKDKFLVIIQNSKPDEENNVAYKFDITSTLQKKKEDSIKLSELLPQLDSMHEGIEEVFHLILTEKAKQTFVEKTDA